MTDQDRSSYRSIWMLGAAMALPAILVSGPVAGYFIGHMLLVKLFKAPGVVVPVFVFFGFIVSGIQAYRLINKIKRFDKQDNDLIS